jgi:hypothetical protein
LEIIIAFWFLYFWDVIWNPQKWASSENVTSFLPISRLCGESWRKGKIPKDPYFFSNLIKEGAVYGLFYPPNVIVSYLGSFMGLKKHFNLLVWCQLLHYLFGAIGMYLLTGNVICGLLWGFGGHMMRPEPCLPQTLAWFPWVVMFPWTLGLMILAGFVPAIAILIPLIFYKTGVLSPLLLVCVVGLGLPVIIPILSELRGGVRRKLPIIGKVPFWHMLTMFFPMLPKHYINGVGYWEMNYYLTPIIVLAFFSHNWFLWCLLGLSVVGMTQGCKLWGDRVASRISISMVACLIFMFNEVKLTNITQFILTCLVILFLYPNRKTLPVEVFDKASYDLDNLPKLVGDERYRTNNIPKPWSQGQLHKIRSVGYVGSHANGRFVHLRGGNNGSHNIFDSMEDGKIIDFMGVRWSYGKRPSKRWQWNGEAWENYKAFPREFMVRHYVVVRGVENILKRMCEVDLREVVVLEEEPKHKEFIVTNDVYDNHMYRGNLCFGVTGI